MFTGIIEEPGTVKSIKKGAKSAVISIEAAVIFSDLKPGDSVSVNGVCLTAATVEGSTFTADIMNETLTRSSLGKLTIGNRVNLERAMSASGRFGGHIVTGHIDGTGTITNIKREDIATWYTVKTEPKIMRYIVEKGSVAIDGISLTVANVGRDNFSVSIIPHTAKETVISEKTVGSTVNLENDIIGKYIEKFTGAASGITKEFLIDNSFLGEGNV